MHEMIDGLVCYNHRRLRLSLCCLDPAQHEQRPRENDARPGQPHGPGLRRGENSAPALLPSYAAVGGTARQSPAGRTTSRRMTTAFGTFENQIWYIAISHIRAKHMPMTAPAPIVTSAKGW